MPAFADDRPLIIFDGHCGFCSAGAQFVLKHDRAGKFRLLAAQSNLGRALYRHYGLDPTNYETNILIADGLPWFKSEAGIRIAARLGFPWSMLRASRLLPLRLRDGIYDLIARNRFRFRGRRDVCYAPTAEYRDRFIE